MDSQARNFTFALVAMVVLLFLFAVYLTYTSPKSNHSELPSFSSEQCAEWGGRIVDESDSQAYCAKEDVLGVVDDMWCPCVCCAK
ncbi:MAG: hypothetical protein H6502_05675 [Candidatus Woesearchaeota archaeon]|nr:MAG: hypothetical protein H6502_05675 [Candidatus Woesearchaeota archaeon]